MFTQIVIITNINDETVKRTLCVQLRGWIKMQTQSLNGLQEEIIASNTIQQDDGKEWLLDYYLQTYECLGSGTLYGMRVDKSTPLGVLVDSEETFATTDSRSDALAMIDAFARGTVPPSVLLEMVDEWESELEDSRTILPPGIHTTG